MMQTEQEDVVSREISGIRLTINYDPVNCEDNLCNFIEYSGSFDMDMRAFYTSV